MVEKGERSRGGEPILQPWPRSLAKKAKKGAQRAQETLVRTVNKQKDWNLSQNKKRKRFAQSLGFL